MESYLPFCIPRTGVPCKADLILFEMHEAFGRPRGARPLVCILKLCILDTPVTSVTILHARPIFMRWLGNHRDCEPFRSRKGRCCCWHMNCEDRIQEFSQQDEKLVPIRSIHL